LAAGATEATEVIARRPGTVPVGRPIAGVRVLLADGYGNPVPEGMAGELCLGGAGLARGYRGRPDLTAERFVPSALGTPGARLYRTGDLARRLPGGDLEILGRLDQQVKVRGFRIEPGEIEAALCALPGVEEAAVVVREDIPGDRRLVAYVVPVDREALSAAFLRSELSLTLPESMIPSAFVSLGSLPRTAGGKLDRRALPVPERDPAETGAAPFAEPRTPVEDLLAGLWAEVLGLSRAGADDDFFALGGHSLLATQVVSRLREALGIELPLRRIFEAPTPARLAREVEALLGGEAGAAAGSLPLRPLPRTLRASPPGLSFSQQRLWFLHQMEPESAAYNLPQALRITGRLRLDVLAASLREVVRRHEALRTRFVVMDRHPVQVVDVQGGDPEASPALPLADLTGLPPALAAETARRVADEEASRPFDLAAGPLLRALLVRSGGEHMLLLTLHHI